eukprot:1141337-Pelagomonas_calceolata.AAC.8
MLQVGNAAFESHTCPYLTLTEKAFSAPAQPCYLALKLLFCCITAYSAVLQGKGWAANQGELPEFPSLSNTEDESSEESEDSWANDSNVSGLTGQEPEAELRLVSMEQRPLGD